MTTELGRVTMSHTKVFETLNLTLIDAVLCDTQDSCKGFLKKV